MPFWGAWQKATGRGFIQPFLKNGVCLQNLPSLTKLWIPLILRCCRTKMQSLHNISCLTEPHPPPQIMSQNTKKKRALDLFSGSGSVADALRKKGYEVYSVDIDPRCKANFVVDILEWPVEKLFKPRFFDLIAASPPMHRIFKLHDP